MSFDPSSTVLPGVRMALAGLLARPGLPLPPHFLYTREKEMSISFKSLFFKFLLLATKPDLTCYISWPTGGQRPVEWSAIRVLFSGLAASAPPGNLLDMQILRRQELSGGVCGGFSCSPELENCWFKTYVRGSCVFPVDVLVNLTSWCAKRHQEWFGINIMTFLYQLFVFVFLNQQVTLGQKHWPMCSSGELQALEHF